MWIGKDEINSLMRRAEIGLEFKDQDVSDEDHPDNLKVYNPLSPEELKFYHQTNSFALLSRICYVNNSYHSPFRLLELVSLSSQRRLHS